MSFRIPVRKGLVAFSFAALLVNPGAAAPADMIGGAAGPVTVVSDGTIATIQFGSAGGAVDPVAEVPGAIGSTATAKYGPMSFAVKAGGYPATQSWVELVATGSPNTLSIADAAGSANFTVSPMTATATGNHITIDADALLTADESGLGIDSSAGSFKNAVTLDFDSNIADLLVAGGQIEGTGSFALAPKPTDPEIPGNPIDPPSPVAPGGAGNPGVDGGPVATPEPASLAVWGALAAAGWWFKARRKPLVPAVAA
jgi:hypothetical protein